MKVTDQYFLVRIDKAAQNKKRTMINGLFIPEEFNEMQYNLQYGEVVQIGKRAAQEFPQVNIGDLLLFHHTVEYKPRGAGDQRYNDAHLIDVLENGDELRIVEVAYETFGVVKIDPLHIIPYKNYLFCHEQISHASMQKTNEGIYIPDGWKKTVEENTEYLEELKRQIDDLRRSGKLMQPGEDNYKQVEQIKTMIANINAERKEITDKMNEEIYIDATIIYINPDTNEKWGTQLQPGSRVMAHSFSLYPLDINGLFFTLIPIEYVAIVSPEKDYKLIQNKIIVRPHEKPKKSETGLYIPDTSAIKSGRGVVIHSHEDSGVMAGDEIIYNKRAGCQIIIGGNEDLLMIKTKDAFAVLK